MTLSSRAMRRRKEGKEEGGKRRTREAEGGSSISSLWRQQTVTFAPMPVEGQSHLISRGLKVISGLCLERKILNIRIALHIPPSTIATNFCYLR